MKSTVGLTILLLGLIAIDGKPTEKGKFVASVFCLLVVAWRLFTRLSLKSFVLSVLVVEELRWEFTLWQDCRGLFLRLRCC